MNSQPTDLVLYTNPQSRGRIARWMLEEVGQPYRVELVDYGSIKAPAYLAINPMGKVPTLRHGDAIVTETAAICAYLADAFPAAGLAPDRTDRLRASYLRWLFFMAGPFEAAASNQQLGFAVPPDRTRMMGYGSGLSEVLNVLEAELTRNEYVAGDHFTAADLYLGSHLGFGMLFKTVPPRPVFEAYWKRVSSRPAKKRADELDDAMLKPRA